MDVPSLFSLMNYLSTLPNFGTSRGLKLLLWQFGAQRADRKSSLWDFRFIPPFPWGHQSVPLWHLHTNWRVLQATVHIDNSSGFGQESPSTIQPRACYFSHICQEVIEGNIFAGQKYSGSVLEMVRTFLAEWLHTRSSHEADPNWSPLLPINSIQFPSRRGHSYL